MSNDSLIALIENLKYSNDGTCLEDRGYHYAIGDCLRVIYTYLAEKKFEYITASDCSSLPCEQSVPSEICVLMPCPFCGCDLTKEAYGYTHPNIGCPLQGSCWDNNSSGLKSWNTRTPVPVMSKEQHAKCEEALKIALRKFGYYEAGDYDEVTMVFEFGEITKAVLDAAGVKYVD